MPLNLEMVGSKQTKHLKIIRKMGNLYMWLDKIGKYNDGVARAYKYK